MAKEHPRYANMEWPEYEYREYPKMVYPGAKNPAKPYDAKGRPLRGILVKDEAEEAEVMGEPAPQQEREPERETGRLVPTGSANVERLKTPEDEKAELIERAGVLGVQIDKRWSIAKIQDAIDTHQQKDVV